MTLRVKIAFSIMMVSLLVSSLIMFAEFRWVSQAEQLIHEERAAIYAGQVEALLKPAMSDTDIGSLNDLVRGFESRPYIRFVRVRGENGDILAGTTDADSPSYEFPPDSGADHGLGDIYFVERALLHNGHAMGSMEIGVDMTGNRNLVSELSELGGRLVVALIGFLGMISYLLGVLLTRSLDRLSKGAEEIAAHGPGLTIPVKGKDEISRVTKSFNDISSSLAESYRVMNENAERQKNLSANLAERDVMQGAMLSTALDAIITIDGEGIISEYNSAAEQTFGYSYEEAVGQEMAGLIVPVKYREAHREGMLKWHETGEGPVLGNRLEIEAQDKQGRVFPIELAITSLDLEGLPYFTAFIRDITERKKAEEELVAARSEAESANEAKSRFLANMSHEIRTPLNAIVNLSALLLDTPLDAQQKRLALAANEGGVALSALLDGILDFSKIEAGQMQLQAHTFNLHVFIQQLNALFLPLAEKTGLEFSTHVDQRVPTWVNGDETMLRQVLLNLVGNALKFTSSGSVTVTLVPGERARVLFRVEDTGVGIGPGYVQDLFKEFSQADSSMTRKHGGTGLGLPISRSLVELMGGEIEYQPNEKAGSIFQFNLPLLAVRRPGIGTTADRTRPDSIAARVLVAEDSRGSQMVAEALLKNVGCEVRLVSDGSEAVRAVAEESFDIVLMDLSMPNMDGLEATRRIRAMKGASSRVPIIALTANAFTDDRERCTDAGMNDFIAKPISMNDLLDRIVHWVTDEKETSSGSDSEAGEAADDEPELMSNKVLSGLEQETSSELMTEIIGIFINETDEKMTALLEAGEQENLASVVAEAHAIKSSASTFGALRLQEAAHRVELLGRQGKRDEAIALIGAVESIAMETRNAYKQKFMG